MKLSLSKHASAFTLLASCFGVDLTDALDRVTNYAYGGGAWSDTTNTRTYCDSNGAGNCATAAEEREALADACFIAPGFTQQIDNATTYLLDFDCDKGDIITIFIGLADYQFLPLPPNNTEWYIPYTGPNDTYPLWTAPWTLNNIAKNLETIYEKFQAKHIFIMNLFESCPEYPGCDFDYLKSIGFPDWLAIAARTYGPIWADGIETGMQKVAEDFNNTHPGATLTILDLRSKMKALRDSNDFVYSPQSCVANGSFPASNSTVGYDCSPYFYMDNSHVTSEVVERVVNEKGLAGEITSALPSDYDVRRVLFFGSGSMDNGAFLDTMTKAGISNSYVDRLYEPPYFDGRFMNSYNLAEHIEIALGLQPGKPFLQSSKVSKSDPNINGDPHIQTWSGRKYDFHGVCDLVLLQNPDFQDGVGMDIHVRTKQIKQFSYVSSAVLQIGDDTLEVMGDLHENLFWFNKEANASLDKGISGYPMSYRKVNSKQHEFIVDLGGRKAIVFKTFKKFVRVSIQGASKDSFGKSLGLLGSYGSGKLIARDKTTTLEDTNIFGQEWQVLPSEDMLFHNVEGPQAPEKCDIPLANSLRRRLAESNTSKEEAEIICAGVNQEDFDVCVFDVMATGDKDVVGAY